MLVGSLKSSAPTVGEPYTLQIVASCALGGTSLAGGKGSVLGTILGVFTVALINNGMTFVGVDAYWQNVIFGAFVLGAIALTLTTRPEVWLLSKYSINKLPRCASRSWAVE